MSQNKDKKNNGYHPLPESELYAIRQNSNYDHGKSAPDNNIFFEERSNPLSSKGN